MRGALHFLAAAAVALLAFWAYQVTYDAQAALDRVAARRAEIAREREAIAVLEAEWAWLNRPDRIAELTARHADALALSPMAGARYRPFSDAPTRPPDAPAAADGFGGADADVAAMSDAEGRPRR
ncbi:MAG: cell division protein FtsL [Rhodobacteraceae bacterium]|nr:MAG: cell division protein FtsL [Paracoccaceae bacterium]